MRRFDEPIDVRPGLIGTQEGPAHFLWRRQLWKVTELQHRWIETLDWWNSARVRAARGDVESEEDEGDLLAEQEVWRVVAAPGRWGSPGVYELAHSWGDGSWSMRSVVD